MMIKFKGKLTATPRGGGGTLVPVPRDVATKLGLRGMPKIQAVIAGQPYRGSLMPMGDGTWCLGVLKSIQEAAGVGFGDAVTVELEHGGCSPSATRTTSCSTASSASTSRSGSRRASPTLNAASHTVNGKPAIGQVHCQKLTPFSCERW